MNCITGIFNSQNLLKIRDVLRLSKAKVIILVGSIALIYGIKKFFYDKRKRRAFEEANELDNKYIDNIDSYDIHVLVKQYESKDYQLAEGILNKVQFLQLIAAKLVTLLGNDLLKRIIKNFNITLIIQDLIANIRIFKGAEIFFIFNIISASKEVNFTLSEEETKILKSRIPEKLDNDEEVIFLCPF